MTVKMLAIPFRNIRDVTDDLLAAENEFIT